MPFTIIKNDITKVMADAIVDPANPYPTYGGGTDAAIYRAAGAQKLLEERKMIGNIGPGNCAVTHAFNLHASYIIHTVGPAWEGGTGGEMQILTNCYRNCLEAARRLRCRSIAFPLLATGVYGFPKDAALVTALGVITEFLTQGSRDHDMEVILVVYDDDAFVLPVELMEGVRAYVNSRFVRKEPEEEAPEKEEEYEEPEEPAKRRGLFGLFGRHAKKKDEEEDEDDTEDERPLKKAPAQGERNREQMRGDNPASGQGYPIDGGENFQSVLFRLSRGHGMSDADVYRRANLTAGEFDALRSGRRVPDKDTVLALAIALRLSLDGAQKFLASAGYAFSSSEVSDLIVEYCLLGRICNIVEVNAILYDRGQKLLGA